MGKKGKSKKPKDDTPESEVIKEAGNKAFLAKNYEEAVKQYTMAIEITLQTPNHIYYANRANAYLELQNYEECINDCNQSIKIDKTFIKSYFRKAKAYIGQQKLKEALDTLNEGLEVDPENVDFKKLAAELAQEIEDDNRLPPDHPERKRFGQLLEWMDKGGADHSKMKLRFYSDNYRGVHAKTDIKAGETVLMVPLEQIITLEMAYRSPIGQQMYEKQLRSRLISPKHSFLGAYLLQERQKQPKDRFFQPFLEILPQECVDFPIFFQQEELSYLEGSPFLKQIEEKKEDIKLDYDLICKEVPDFKVFTLLQYSEVRMMTCSRIFGITVDNVKTDGFVPYADMLNHRRPRQTIWYYDDNRKGFIIEACDDIQRGEQVYDSYGKKCNSRFFLNYGFINQPNDADEVPLRITINPNDPGAEVKNQLLAQHLRIQKFRVVANLQDEVMQMFIEFARYIVFNDDLAHLYLAKTEAVNEFMKKKNENKKDGDSEEDPDDIDIQEAFKGHLQKISKENETAVWDLIDKVCDNALDKYTNTLEEDEKILAQDDQDGNKLGFNKRNCVLYRKGEKVILHFLKDCASRVKKLMKMSSKDAKKEINQWSDMEHCDSYFKQVICSLLQ